MDIKLAASFLLIGALLAPVVGYTYDVDTDRSHPKEFIKDSAIAKKIKARLADVKMSSLTQIRVDHVKNGIVWLSGTANTQQDSDKAALVTSETEGVAWVNNHIKIKMLN